MTGDSYGGSGDFSLEGHATLAQKVTLPFGQGSRYLCLEGHATFALNVLPFGDSPGNNKNVIPT